MDNKVPKTSTDGKDCDKDKRIDMQDIPDKWCGNSGGVCREGSHPSSGIHAAASVSKLVQYMKGNTSRKLQIEYKELNKEFWSRHLWARGYFVASSGNVMDEIIQEYIKNQDLEEWKKSDNFEIEQL